MGSSLTRIATACPTGDTGSTTCPSTRPVGGPTGRGGRTSAPVGLDSPAGPPYASVGGAYFDSYYPPDFGGPLWFFGGRSTPNGYVGGPPSGNYYVWASVIEDGRVVATDYAPDLGWLDPSLLGRGRNRLMPFGASNGTGNGVCVDPPQRGCRETDWDLSISIDITVPDGWTLYESVERALTKRDTGTVAPSGMSLHFRRGGWLYSQPCRNADGPPDIRVGPTASNFADALAAHPLLDVTTPVRVTLGGHSGHTSNFGCRRTSPTAPPATTPGGRALLHPARTSDGTSGASMSMLSAS